MKKVAISVHAKSNFSIDILRDLIGIDYIHVDVMDGIFVKSKNLNLDAFKIIKYHFNIPIIAHMMVQDPSNYLDEVINYVDFFLFHFEIEEDKLELIEKVKKFNKKVGIVLNPDTNVSAVEFLLKNIDLILILGVQPGWSGQEFIPETVNKINELVKYKKSSYFLIDVDGGINLKNVLQLKNADILTSSSTILNAKDPNKVIKLLKNSE